jgi:hypothetical protein
MRLLSWKSGVLASASIAVMALSGSAYAEMTDAAKNFLAEGGINDDLMNCVYLEMNLRHWRYYVKLPLPIHLSIWIRSFIMVWVRHWTGVKSELRYNEGPRRYDRSYRAL